MPSQLDALVRRIASLEKWRLQSKQPNLGFSTIEGGALQTTDEDGVVRQIAGQQGDGTYTTVDVNGPPPPTPLEPTVGVQPGLLNVSSYGLTVDGAPWPADFRRLDVHVSTTPGFTPDLNTRVNEFSVEGGAVSLALPEGNYYVKLVAVSTSGTKSPASVEVSATVTPPESGGAGGANIYRTDSPPVGLGPSDKALWFDTDNGNLQSFWDGDSWEPMPLGPEATAEDIIAGKKVPLGSRVELQWGVPDPSEAPDFLYESLKPIWSPGITTGSFRGLVVDGGSYVQMQTIEDPATLVRSHRPVFLSSTDGSVTYGDFLPELNATYLDTGVTPNRTASLFPSILGMTKMGTTWYVLASKQSVYPAPRTELFRYDANWNFISSTNVGISGEIGTPYHGLTNDGTNLITMYDEDFFAAGSNPTKIEVRNPTTWALVSSTTVTGADLGTTGGHDPVDILPLANYDFGAPRYAILARLGSFFPTFKVVVVDSAGTQQATTFPVKQGYLGDEITSFRWNSTVSQYEFGGAYGGVTRTTALASDINVWTGYTLYDSVADPDTHESALSPVTTATTAVRKRHGLVFNGYIPTVDDDQAPDTIRVYARVGDATQPAKADMDLQTTTFIRSSVSTNSVDNETVVAMFIEQPVNGGAAPPAVSSFPAAPSGEVVSELGGMVIRGDGTINSPFLTRLFDERYDGRYSPRSHTHDVYDAWVANFGTRVKAVEADVTALEAADSSLDGRLDTAESTQSSISNALTAIGARDGSYPTASTSPSGSYTGGIDFVRIGNLVFASGYVDRATGFSSASHDTGARIPAGFRPTLTPVVGEAKIAWNTTSTYRFRYYSTGVIEVQQSAAIGTFQVADAFWVTADTMPS